MNIVNKLTLRHLLENKRRTLVTIIGVIISVAMITAVATLAVSFIDLLQRQTIATDGEWHVMYQDVNREQLQAIKADDDTKSLAFIRDNGHAILEDGKNNNKPYLFIQQYNAQGFLQFPFELVDGRTPQSENEVIIPEELVRNTEYKVGDQLVLEVGQRVIVEEGSEENIQPKVTLNTEVGTITETLQNTITKSYTIVGIMKHPKWYPISTYDYTMISYTDGNQLGADDTVKAFVVVNNINRSLYDHAEQIAEQNSIQSVYFNNDLLRYYGVTKHDGFNKTIISLFAIIMGVILVGSVSLIYNAFAISVSERSRHLGMLASVGATRRQKRNSVFFEGAVIGLVSIPIGFGSGLAGIGITFMFINSIIQGALGVTETLRVIVTPISVLITCVVAILTIFISTYIPARRASKISAIDAIRQTADLKLTGKKVKTSRLIRKLFGMEAEIALKNLKRNKRRYQATVFSLIISIVLFLVVTFFTDNLKKSLELSQDGVNYDIEVFMSGELSESGSKILQSYSTLEDVIESNQIQRLQNVNSLVEEAYLADKLLQMVQNDPNMLRNGKYPYHIKLVAINDEYLQAYAQTIGLDYAVLKDPDRAHAIVVDTVPYEDGEAGKYAKGKAIYATVGQTLNLTYFDTYSYEEKDLGEVVIAALTDQHPMGILPEGLGGLTIIVSDASMARWNNESMGGYLWSALYLKTTDPLKTQQEIEDTKESNMHVYNIFQSRQREGQMILILSVFAYGFITLITAISIANIFNTISTSIALRKREFAMLKSVGMTPKGFNKMIHYESMFYGIKSLLYGLPIGIGVMYLIYRSLMNTFEYSFSLPWVSIGIVIVSVFIIVSSAMLYSSAKVKKENIIDALKLENI